MKKNYYRILNADYTVKFAGTGEDSYFYDLSKARELTDTSKGEMIYEYDYNNNRILEVI